MNSQPLRRAFSTTLFVCFVGSAPLSAQLYWRVDGASATLTSSSWSTSGSAPYSGGWVNSSDIVFAATSAITNVTNTPVGNLSVTGSSTVTWTPSGTFSTGGTVRTFDIGSGSTLRWSNQNISGSAGTVITKSGAGTWDIGAPNVANSFGFTLNAGRVIVGGVNAMGTGAVTINGGIIAPNSGAARDFSGKFTSLSIGGNFQLGDSASVPAGTGNLTFGAASLGNAVRTVTIGGSGTYTFNNVLSGGAGGGLAIAATGSGSLVLSGSNSYSGGTTVNGGTLTLGHASDTLADTGAVTVAGGTLALGTNSDTVGAVTISAGNITGTGTLSGDSYAVSGGTIGAKLGGGGAMTVTGSATLSGANTGWSGNTAINGGTLDLGNGSALGSGTVTVNPGGTLDIGAQTVANTLSLNSGTVHGSGGALGGTIIGSGALTGPLTLNASAIYQLTSLSDSAASALTLGAGATLSLNSAFTISLTNLLGSSITTASNHSWTVIDGRAAGATVTSSSPSFAVTNAGQFSGGAFAASLANNILTLNWTASAIPEPATYAALCGALVLAGTALWRRRTRGAASPPAELPQG